MARGTIIVLSFLAVIAVLLFGINLGKKLNTVSNLPQPTIIQTTQTTPTVKEEPTNLKETAISTFTDETCGYTFSYPNSYMKQKTANQKSVIYVDADNPEIYIAASCAANLPRPPVGNENKETIILDGETGTLYHDKDPNGNPRDDIFVKHPTNGMEIVIVGYGDPFNQVRSSFKFIK